MMQTLTLTTAGQTAILIGIVLVFIVIDGLLLAWMNGESE